MKAILFDFDGTLADTLPICFYAFQSVFKEFDDIEVQPDEIKAMFGPSETGIIMENLSNENYASAIERYYEKYREKHSDLVPENIEINNMLLKLKELGFQLGIVTGKARRSLEISLEKLNLNDFFDVTITGDDVSLPKPHPEGIMKALEILNVSNREAVFLGDSDADIKAGIQAEVYTIGVQWLPNYQSLQFELQPSRMLSSVADFMKIINDKSLVRSLSSSK